MKLYIVVRCPAPSLMALPLSGSGAHTSVRKVTTFHWPELDWVAPGNCWGAWEKKPGWVISKKRTRVTSTWTPGSLSYPFSLSSRITPTLCPTLPAPGPRGFLSLLPQPRRHCSTGHEAWARPTSSSPPANYLCLPTEGTLALVGCPLYLRTMAAHPTLSATGHLWCLASPVACQERTDVTTKKYRKLNDMSPWETETDRGRQRCLCFLPQLPRHTAAPHHLSEVKQSELGKEPPCFCIPFLPSSLPLLPPSCLLSWDSMSHPLLAHKLCPGLCVLETLD